MIETKIIGVEELEANLKLRQKIAKEEAAKAVMLATLEGHQTAVRLAPVKTGHLRASIQFKFIGKPIKKGRFFTTTWYSHFLELGTKRIAPKLFMFQGSLTALMRLKDSLQIIKDKLEKAKLQ